MADQRKMIIVAGMHRSGTSVLARVINLLGADIATNLIPAGVGNELGHWESRIAQDLHNAMLADAGSSVMSAINFHEDWFAGEAAQGFVAKVADHISREYAGSKLFVMKDPRVALFIPIWLAAARELSLEPCFVIPFRHPSAVAASLESRQRKLDPFDALPLPQGMAVWLRYVLAAERSTRACRRSFVSFESLLADWPREMERVGRQIGVAWPRWDRNSTEIGSFLDGGRLTATAHSGVETEVDRISNEVHSALARAVNDPDLSSEVFDTVGALVSQGENVLGACLLAKERQVRELREMLDQRARQHAEDMANAHRAFDAEIRERDKRLKEAMTYAKAQEARANRLEANAGPGGSPDWAAKRRLQ